MPQSNWYKFNAFLLFFFLSSTLFAQNVVVIGAGLSGLTTAYRLQEKGFDVEVYEARNRVGGRVFTVKIEDHIAELGAQNIKDGGEALHLLNLAKELGLEVAGEKKPFQYTYFDQEKMVDISSVIKERKFTPAELKSSLELIQTHTHNMKEVLDAFFHRDDILYTACSIFLSSYEGAPVEKLSSFYVSTLYHILLGGVAAAHQNGGEEKRYIEHLWIKGGNGLLAERLATKLAPHVHLQEELVSIGKTSTGTYVLSFKNGTTTCCDILILTLPCPVYESISIENNVIPEERLTQIKSIVYGTNAKILLPISPTPLNSIGVHTNGRVVTFRNSDGHILNLYYILDYGKFTPETLKPTFQSDLDLVQRIYTTLPYLPPMLARDASFAEYHGPVAHSWPNDPFARGSYSCIGAHQEEIFTTLEIKNGEYVKTLFAPIDDTLFFAGEHTSILLDVGGTMEAAIESGERTARLVEKLRLQLVSFYLLS